jgi:hypothetical protein
MHYLSAWGARSYTSGAMAEWESENDGPIAVMREDIFHALDRLESNDGRGSAISV